MIFFGEKEKNREGRLRGKAGANGERNKEIGDNHGFEGREGWESKIKK